MKIILNDGANTEICRYTKQKWGELNTFIYLINGQINKINSKNNQDFPEKPKETDGDLLL